MDSLLATYSSSDDDSDDPPSTTSAAVSAVAPPPSSLFSSLPKPQSTSSPFTSLPPPKSSSLFFSSLPTPKTLISPPSPNPNPNPNPKRIVQFQPPLPPNLPDDDDDDDVKRDEVKNKQLGHVNSSVKSFLSSMPTPKSSLGSGAPGSNRIAIGDAVESSPSVSGSIDAKIDVGVSNLESYDVGGQGNWVSGSGSEGYDVGGKGNWVTGPGSESYDEGGQGMDGSNSQSYEVGVGGYEGYGGVYGSSSGYDSYGSYGQYGEANGGNDGLSNSVPIESYVNVGGKRRKDQVPLEIVEVKQDELMKNRPREDKSKLTGIAFGPSYQPASTKGKPSKLHKRKHQIGALYFDMRQKEMELAERRSKGLLTKAETQAKYGW